MMSCPVKDLSLRPQFLQGAGGARILDFRFWIKELKFNPKDALYETRKGRGLALSERKSVSKSCHAAGFTLRYRQFHYPKLNYPIPHAQIRKQ